MYRRISLFVASLMAVMLLAFIPVRLSIFGGTIQVQAAGGTSQNPEEVELYFLEDSYKKSIDSIPSDLMTDYQINVDGLEGKPSYRVISGSSAVVSSQGLITPKATTWYWKNGFGTTSYVEGADVRIEYKEGLTTVRVTCGDYVQDISVKVIDYSERYAEDKMNRILDEIITEDMSQLDKLKAITKWVGENTDYSVNYQSANSMMIHEAGDCWASTNTIVAMCKKLGIEARARRGNQDALSGSGHMNALVVADGKYYIAEAGYAGKRPRHWEVYEEPEGFSVSGSTIYQYDGNDQNVVVPAEINGRTITGFGNGKASVFDNMKIESVHLPATITHIGKGAFTDAEGLKKITVDEDNPSYCTVDGILYTKDRTRLIFTPPDKTSVVIDGNCQVIDYTGIMGCDLDRLVIPSNVKTLNTSAFYNTSIGELVIEEGLEHLGNSAFNGISTPRIVIPTTLKTMDIAPFYNCGASEIILPEGITEIPQAAFQDSGIKKMDIPDGVKSIGEAAFKYCRRLSEVSIPLSVTSIGKNAFDSSGVRNIYYSGTEEEWKTISMGSELPSGITVRFSSVRVTGVEAPETITLTERGQTAELAARVLPENASNQEVVYKSDNTSVASVTGNVVKAYSEGECNITATTVDGGYTATWKVIVKYPRYKLTIIDGEISSGSDTGKTEVEYKKDTYIYIKSSKTASNDGLRFKNWEYEGDLTFPSGSDNSASICIKMPTRDLTIKAVYDEVKISSLYSIRAASKTLCAEEDMDLTVNVYPSYAFNKKIAWSSDNTDVLTVDENGHIKALSLGRAVIKAETTDGSNLSRTAEFTVRDHKWGQAEVISPATCTETGQEKYTCQYCAKTKEEVIPALDHDWDEGKVTLKPTCEEKGVKTYSCEREGCQEKRTEDLPALDHDWDEGKVTLEPTCEEKGVKTYSCKREGCQEKRTEDLPALDHDWDEGKVTLKPTCEKKGVKTYSCKREGCQEKRTEDLPALGHDYKEEVTEPTCTEAGYTSHTCQRCKASYRDHLVEAKGHTSGDAVKEKETPATCTEEGHYDKVVYCTVCKEELSRKTVTIPATGHKTETIPAVAPTCEEEGYTEGSKCTICGKTLSGHDLIPATGHDFSEKTVNPSCTEEGYTEFSCKHCTYSYRSDYQDPLGHTEEIDEAVPATETEPGLTEGSHCSVCGQVLKEQEIIPKKTVKETKAQTVTKPDTPNNPAHPDVEVQEKRVLSQKGDKDPQGSTYALLSARVKKSSKTSNTLIWNRVKGASGYIIYGNRCGTKYRFKKMREIRGTRYVHKKLKKGTYYKYLVVAYRQISGKKTAICTSKTIHAATSGGKVGNCKKLKVNKKKVTLKRKKTFKIKAKEVPASKKRKIKRHRKVAFESSNPKIATVTSSGKIKALKKGSCTVYAYAQNGVAVKIRVLVK